MTGEEHEDMFLSVVCQRWLESKEWPTFASVDRPLYRQGIDAAQVLQRLSPAYARSDHPQSPGAEDKVRLSVAGLARVPNAAQLLGAFLRAVQYIAQSEVAYDPAPDDPVEPEVTSSDIISLLTWPRSAGVAKMYADRIGPILREEGQIWGGFSVLDDGGWRITVRRRARDFANVQSVEDYLTVAADRDLVLAGPVYGPSDIAEERTMIVPDNDEVADPRNVFIVHGRDAQAREALASFLRALDLHPLEWEELVSATGATSPYIGEAVNVAFRTAQAVIVLLTPDDEARLHPQLHGSDEPSHETELSGQARPNVLFEAGMALASHPNRTILVEVGQLRPWSDVAGRHVVRLTGASSALNALAGRLENAGCPVNRTNSGWLDTSRFASLDALTRRPAATTASATPTAGHLPRGTVLSTTSTPEPRPQLAARLLPHGNDHLLEIVNRGGVRFRRVAFDIPDSAGWHVVSNVLPEYPIPQLDPREHVRIPVALSLQSSPIVDVTLSGELESGELYKMTTRLSIYG